ncbi:MAG: Gfo/Idh/MocA family oxidoreductase [Clostridia bacterium]|nr:Gfo/Idh/MocA family oxidoreductase [Clostridia bacterium]
MNRKLNFTVYGCGMISDVHALAAKSLDNAELMGCADINPDRAADFAKKHGIHCYGSLEDMLSDTNVDVVCICTPNGTHAPLAIKVLEADKNVIVEKPMAINVKGCDMIIAAAEKSKGRIMVISQLRTAPDIVKAKELVQSGAIGKVVLCDLYMKYHRDPEYYKDSWHGTLKMDGGGALINQGIHGIDMLQYIAGSVKTTKSFVKTLVHNIEAEDTVVSAVEFESGAIGVIEASTSITPGYDREIKIHGSRGCIEICHNCIERLVIDGEEQQMSKYVSRGDSSNPNTVTYEDHARQFDTFIRAINGENVEYIDQYEGKKSVEIIQRIYADKE